MTASLAWRALGNRAVATVVGMTGASRMVTSVTMPRVPSAPINSFVVSNPADDLRDRRLVFITSPEGRTTVCRRKISIILFWRTMNNADHIQEPFTLRCAVADRIGYWEKISEVWSITTIGLTSGATGAEHATDSRRGTRIELRISVRTK